MAKRPKLSLKRRKWTENRTVVTRGTPLVPNLGTATQYQKKMMRLLDAMAKETEREINKLLKMPEVKVISGQDASVSSALRIIMNKLDRKYDRIFRESSKTMADNFAKQVDGQSELSLKMSLKQLSGGLTIKTDTYTAAMRETLAASIQENVGLIKSVPVDYLGSVRAGVLRSIQSAESGGLAGLKEQIHDLLSEKYKKQKNRAKNISTDQTRKLYNQINADRIKSAGVNEFEWRHAGGSQKPRQEHIRLNGTIHSFDDLPVINSKTGRTGIPGDEINCKCYMVPVLRFDDGKVV